MCGTQNSGNCAVRCICKCRYMLSLDGCGGESSGPGQCLREVTWQVNVVICDLGLTSDSISVTHCQKAPYAGVFVELGLSSKSRFFLTFHQPILASHLVFTKVLSLELRRPVCEAVHSSTVSGVGAQSTSKLTPLSCTANLPNKRHFF